MRKYREKEGIKFQFTPLREGRRGYEGRKREGIIFQFTPLREGRRVRWITIKKTRRNFNSRPSARGDTSDFANIERKIISIHAPPRGATTLPTENYYERNISIHAPPRGATRTWSAMCCFAMHFNSRPSARGDGVEPVYGEWILTFQFTPLREGRPGWLLWFGFIVGFQFTPLREGRRYSPRISALRSRFQFTPLREGRREGGRADSQHHDFNSRPSARGDRCIVHREGSGIVFQFTPLREGRRADDYQLSAAQISIHAPPRGATNLCNENIDWSKDFNSRPSARGDARRRVGTGLLLPISIHAPPRGATQGILTSIPA